MYVRTRLRRSWCWIASMMACTAAMAQTNAPPAPPAAGAGAIPATTKLTIAEIERIVAPIALYPDVLLAQVLPASTFPMDVVLAARWLRSKPDMGKLLEKPWDPSVLSLCHYPDAVYKLDADLEWTNALGATFLDQQADLMSAIQSLRAKAKTAGSLQSTPQQVVVAEEESIRIVPADPQVVYVPQYNPQVIYVEDDDDDWVGAAAVASAISFGAGMAMGAWLDTDCDWHGGVVHYCRPGYWGGYGPIHGHVGVAWGDDWAAAVGPRRAAISGENGGAYVGPRGAAVWGDNGHGAAWSRGGAVARPYNSGRYANYGAGVNRAGQVNRATQVNRGMVGSNNQVNINHNNVNIDRGRQTNVGNINNAGIGSGNRGSTPGQLPYRGGSGDNRGGLSNQPSHGATPTPFSGSSNYRDARTQGDRGQQSRGSNYGGASSYRGTSDARQQPSRTSAAPQNYGGSQRSSAYSGAGRSGSQTQNFSSRGGASRGGSRGGGGGGRGGRR